MNTTQKRTDELTVGDVLLLPEVDSKNRVLPISDEHPGYLATVTEVADWMLTAGPYAGQQARKGRRNTGEPLMRVTVEGWPQGNPVGTPGETWNVVA